MTDPAPPPDNVIAIRDAVANAKPVASRRARPKPIEQPAASPPGGPPGFFDPVTALPEEAPVKALGKLNRTYFFLDSVGQRIALKDSEIGRLSILGLFGTDDYLIAIWPTRDKKGELRHEWDHGKLAPILIKACTGKGLWNPLERERGPGGWAESDGTFVLHCGDVLWLSRPPGEEPLRAGTGLRAGFLYPRSEKLPEPVFAPDESPAADLLEFFETCSWQRPGVDPKLMVGEMACMLLGGAPAWRPVMWLTGASTAGKSTVQRLIHWTIGDHAIIKSENATAAGISQTVGVSSLPVAIDEAEARKNDDRLQQIIELARIAADGGVIRRGGQDGMPTKTTLRNCFFCSSILMPPLKPQDRNRMAILSLKAREKGGKREPGDDAGDAPPEDDSDDSDDRVLGLRDRWARVGQLLRGRILTEWHRYGATFKAYRAALIRAGHADRAADLYGALGAGFDLVMYRGADMARAAAWAGELSPLMVADAAEAQSEERQCLDFLLTALPEFWKDGARETVSHYLRAARVELIADWREGAAGEAKDDALRVLARMGLRLHLDKAAMANCDPHARGRDVDLPWPWLAISHTHQELVKQYRDTRWKGEAGATGTWAQAFGRLYGAVPKRLRIDGVLQYCTLIPWETVFPKAEEGEE